MSHATTLTPVAETAVETVPAALPKLEPLDAVLNVIARDALQSPERYLVETIVPAGGE
jgi:hypothetical protein